MNRSEITQAIVQIVKDYILSINGLSTDIVDENSRLFGQGGLLDSLGLVTVVLDLEQLINDRLGLAITIADDRAMAMTRSPFRTIASLADYALVLISEEPKI